VGRTHSLGGEGGGGVNILEDAGHSSVLYICTGKYFVGKGNSRRILGDVEAFLDGEKSVLEGLQALGLLPLTALKNVRHVLEQKNRLNKGLKIHLNNCMFG
jgi:hypothetical protein